MNKKTIIQLTSIAALLLLIAAGALRQEDTAIQSPSPWEGEADRIEISSKQGEIILQRKEDSWKVGKKLYPADQGKVLQMTDALNKLELRELVSKRGDLKRYGLKNDDRIQVRVFSEDRPLRELSIGKSALGSTSYISFAGRGGIFLAAGDLRYLFDTDEESLRNKQIIALSSSDIIAVNIEGPEVDYSIRKAAEKGLWYIPELKGMEEDQEKISAFISQLSRISAQGFSTEQDTDAEALWSFTIQAQEEERELSVITQESEQSWIAASPESREAFTISSYKADQLMRKAEWFIKQQDSQ